MIYTCKYYPNITKEVEASSFEDAIDKIYKNYRWIELTKEDYEDGVVDIVVSDGHITKYFMAVFG